MKVTYEGKITSRCPADSNVLDEYEFIIQADHLIEVERLFEFVLASEPIFQEALTEAIAKHFGCTVTTIGTHSGVKTTCMA